MDATERLLEHRLFSDITVKDIAEEAGVSTGLLYSRFESKNAILPYLVTRFMAEQKASFRDSLGGDAGAEAGVASDSGTRADSGTEAEGIRERVETLVRQVSGMADRSAGLLRAAAARRLLNPEVLSEEEIALSSSIRALGRSWLDAGTDEVRHEDPERALDFVNWMVFLAGQLAPMLVDDEEERAKLMDDLTDAMTLYLTVRTGSGKAVAEDDV